VIGSINSYKPIINTAWVRDRLCKLQKGCTRLASASDKAYQLLAHGRWSERDQQQNNSKLWREKKLSHLFLFFFTGD
jgi:hypothetical protein